MIAEAGNDDSSLPSAVPHHHVEPHGKILMSDCHGRRSERTSSLVFHSHSKTEPYHGHNHQVEHGHDDEHDGGIGDDIRMTDGRRDGEGHEHDGEEGDGDVPLRQSDGELRWR